MTTEVKYKSEQQTASTQGHRCECQMFISQNIVCAGVITYATNPPQFRSYLKYLQNRVCTVADSVRVGEDFGKIRCQLTYLNKPIFGWKGSYVVCNVSRS